MKQRDNYMICFDCGYAVKEKKLQVYYSKSDAIDCINATPTADVANVKHGKWMDNCNGTFTCSVCGGKASKMNYCGNCGAKMKGGD